MTTADKKGPDQIKADIEKTRAELGDTVDELAGSLDVKARAREKAATTGRLVRERYGRLRADRRTLPAAGAVVAVSTVLALVVWRRRR